MKTVTILRGISGAGKSTYIKNNFSNAVVASADNFFIENGTYNFNPTKLGKAHEFSFQIFSEALNRNINEVVVDNTNTKLWEFKKYIDLALSKNYTVNVIRLKVPVSVAAKRNLHGVPESKVQEMQDRFQDFAGEILVESNG